MALKTRGLVTRQLREQLDSKSLSHPGNELEGSPLKRLNQRDFISVTTEEGDIMLKMGRFRKRQHSGQRVGLLPVIDYRIY